ncbi:6-phosphogluconolactonase [Coprinellus micaceus]|uniref:6-phosphogluconolactonase n=1 Tax=Coprinellus micaceus TaxID=71717 RepID=A0A4Y7TCU7_COPMI|nr:6-phosphogluconolactonase [Coprinellus micaceus]
MSTPSAPVLFSFPTKDGLRDALSSFVAKTSADAIAKHGSFAIAISGGNVPKPLGGLIKEPTVQWDKWHVYYVDERVVPLDHADSNHKLCLDTLWSKVPIPQGQIHPIDTNHLDNLQQLSISYAQGLKADSNLPSSGDIPSFDLILLRLGADGHTASLFPGRPALSTSADQLITFAEDAPREPSKRVTFTISVINNALRVAFVCTGAEKAEALKNVLDGPEKGLPASRVKPAYWFVDDSASAKAGYQRTPFDQL